MQKIKIGVLMGGKSQEREVSFNSGRTICDHIDTSMFTVVPLFQTSANILYLLPQKFLYCGKISDFEAKLPKYATAIVWDHLSNYVDFVYIAQLGKYSEDGCLQGFLNLLGIPFHGSNIFASALGMSKVTQKIFLQQAGIKTPKGLIVEPYKKYKTSEIIKYLEKQELFFPYIIKPDQEGSSFGVSVVHNEQELSHAIEHAHYISHKPQSVIIEELIDGMEFCCMVIADPEGNNMRALPPTEIIKQPHTIFDYEQKYMPGSSLQRTPASCSLKHMQEIQEISLKTATALEFRTLARIDGFLDKQGNVIITDPNSLPGTAPSSFFFKQAAEIGLNHTQIIHHIIVSELKAIGMENKINQYIKNHPVSKKNKLRVAVLMGGKSNEKEISVESGRNIIYKLSPHKYDVVPLFVNKKLNLHRLNTRMLVCNSTREIEALCSEGNHVLWQNLKNLADFVFICLLGGEGENGAIQGTLELLNIPYNGSSVLTSALCMNKYKTAQFLKAHGFNVPKNLLLEKSTWYCNEQECCQLIENSLSYPLIIKPTDDGCSSLVQKVHTQEKMIQAVQLLFKEKSKVLIEEYIHGMELTGGVIGNNSPIALPPSRTIAQHDILSIQEKFLPGAGENQTPAPLEPKTIQFIQKTLKHAYQVLQLKGYARIDCFYQSKQKSPTKKERLIILEVNSLPALTPATCLFVQAAEYGLPAMEFIDKIIMYGLEEHQHMLMQQPKPATKQSVYT